MILTCPECATRYEIDAATFPAAGRKVRCKKCGHVWFQAGAQGEPVAEMPVSEEPASVAADPVHQSQPEPEAEAEPFGVASLPAREFFQSEPVVEKKARRSRGNVFAKVGVAAGWIALVGVILIIGWSAMSYHQQIAAAWPKSSSLFARMGMSVNASGLDFTDVQHSSQFEDGQPVLVITGKLVNISAKPVKVPALRVMLSDEAHHAIYGWSFSPSANSVAPGKTVSFRTRLSNPPAAARHVDIRFADNAE